MAEVQEITNLTGNCDNFMTTVTSVLLGSTFQLTSRFLPDYTADVDKTEQLDTSLRRNMVATTKPRPATVWTVLSLQTALTAITVYSGLQILAIWSRYPAVHAQLLAREIIPAVVLAVSLIGLWRDKSWGWVLALAADCTLCAEVLWFLLNYPGLARSSRYLAFNILEFAALIVLPYRPVREHFFRPRPHATEFPVRVHGNASQTRRWVRNVIYFAVAAMVTCVVTAFSLSLFMGPKNGGERGFLLLLVVGTATGGVASLLFVFILTAAARQFGPTRFWVWLVFGASLAPALIITLALGGFLRVVLLNFIFWGPATLVQVWWLTPAIGVVTGWVCYLMYPWVYADGVSTRTLRKVR